MQIRFRWFNAPGPRIVLQMVSVEVERLPGSALYRLQTLYRQIDPPRCDGYLWRDQRLRSLN